MEYSDIDHNDEINQKSKPITRTNREKDNQLEASNLLKLKKGKE